MEVSIENIIMIAGAIGGVETLKWGITSWRNRKSDNKKANAEAEKSVADYLNEAIKSLSEQLSKSNTRLDERDVKVDSIYREFRRVEDEKTEVVAKLHEAELKLKDAQYNRCDMPNDECKKRIPPRNNNRDETKQSN